MVKLVRPCAGRHEQLPPTVGERGAKQCVHFAAWVYWNGGANWQRVFDFGNDTSHYLYLSPSSGSGTTRFATRNGGSEQTLDTTALPVGQWQHIAFTLSGNNAKIYTNGALAASSASITFNPSNIKPAQNYLVKARPPPTHCSTGNWTKCKLPITPSPPRKSPRC